MPKFAILRFELIQPKARIFGALQLSDDNIFDVVFFKESKRGLHIRGGVERINLVDAILHELRRERALLPFVPIPSHHAGQAGIDGEARAPAILGAIGFHNNR